MEPNPLLTEIIHALSAALIPVIAAAVAAALSALIADARTLLRARLGDRNAQVVEHYVRLGVLATEQVMRTEAAQVKKQHALDWIENQLLAAGIDYDVSQVDELIEAILAQVKIDGLDMLQPVRERLADYGALTLVDLGEGGVPAHRRCDCEKARPAVEPPAEG